MTRVEKNARALATDHLMADLGRRTARGSVVAILAQAIRLALQLASLAIMARLLAPEDFGVVAMATTATAFVGLFTDLGLSAATVSGSRAVRDWMMQQGFEVTYKEVAADHAGMVPLVLPDVFAFFDQTK